ncbi:hypothetical protein BGZ80_004657 [Entomortierella chlamydospora]|uniref:C3H1-type domain-containing protein n=1 Tax=Entomortierella chlamydospora TaxID=101097 RepID=A0A9P6MM27_9FUNG|nr:hypothetical protein BGZ79_002405 [Entomortierella chlamydospora]KAG0007440.1 hypothetical protein BGZ80_004657 [Entomortierella chlamydospora]
MSSPIQVDGVLLQRLNQLGPAVGLDIQVFKSTGKASTAEATATATAPATENSTEGNKRTKFVFQPQRKYFLEGRIIHKRKLSRKLFFLDVSLVRRKVSSVGEDRPIGSSTSLSSSESTTKGEAIEAQGADGFKRSEWEDIESTHGSTKGHQSPPNYNLCLRMEVIARYPAHSLKELDDLWQKVQLGSVIRVYGDIEVSEKHTSCPSDIANGSGENTQQEQQSRWSALLHCLDFEVLELWQGKDGFEPNPGSSTINGSSKNESNQTSATGQNKKRKSEELSASSPATAGSGQDQSGPVTKHQRGDESQPHCKFWLNSGKCNKEQCLFWHETDQAKLKVERRRWVEETFTRDFLNSGSGVLDIAGGRGDLSWELQTRQGIQSTIVEPRPGKGMRKWQRKWLQKFKASNQQDSPAQSELETISTTELPETLQASDVVEDPEEQEPDEGKVLEGLEDLIPTALTYPLQATEPARIQTMLDDQFLVIHQDLISGASILIGLHPDQATEPIVRTALKLGKPFAVIPCCVFGRDNPHRRLPRLPKKGLETEECVENEENNDPLTRPVTSYDDFVTWLSTLHPDIETTWLNFEGMNRVLYWRGPSIP